jgi:hypothetical protein
MASDASSGEPAAAETLRAAFTVGREDDDHLCLTVLRRFADSPDNWFDYGSLECRVEIRAKGMRANFLGIFRAEGFENLRRDLTELDRAFKPGVVRFEPGYEKALEFSISVGAVGGVWISGVAIDGLGSGVEQHLRFGFGVAEALREILTSATCLADEFPPSRVTQLPFRAAYR